METQKVKEISRKQNLRSYPTYEEWKHMFSKLGGVLEALVLILPMRNGN